MRSFRYVVKSELEELQKSLLQLKTVKFADPNVFSLQFYLHESLLSHLENPKKFPNVFQIVFLNGSGKERGYIKVVGVKNGKVNWNDTKFDYADTGIQTVTVNFEYDDAVVYDKSCDS